MIKLFWKLVSNRFLLQEYTDYMTILNLVLYYDDKDAAEVKHYLNTYLIPEMGRRGLC
jgi:hypothetical protein